MKKEKKVIKILDEYTIIINAGFKEGIKEGDTFQILDTKGNVVKDPDTGEVLGYLDLIKDTVKVTEVQEKMCFCSSTETIGINKVLMSSILNIQDSMLPIEKKRLNVDLDDITGGRERSNAPIKVGDRVRLIKS